MKSYGDVMYCNTNGRDSLWIESDIDISNVCIKKKDCSVVLVVQADFGEITIYMTPKKCRELIKSLRNAIYDVEKHNNEVTENG